MGPVSDAAAYLFSEFDRLHILQSEFFVHDQHFITDHKLAPGSAMSEAALRRRAGGEPDSWRNGHRKSQNAMFAAVLRIGLQSDYLALIEKRYVPVVARNEDRPRTRRTTAGAPSRISRRLAGGGCGELHAEHQAGAGAFFLRLGGAQTDRDTGLARLRLTAEKGRYLAPFARLMLAVAALREDGKPRARTCCAGWPASTRAIRFIAQELSRLETWARGHDVLPRTTDVFVIGGGPAGLAAAIAARRLGFDVTLADCSVPPVDKACGEGIMPDGLAAARALGLDLSRPRDGDSAASGS